MERHSEHYNSKREQTQAVFQRQSISQREKQSRDTVIIPRSRRGRRPISFLHAVLIVLLCPYLIASFQDALFFGSGSDDVWAIQSSRSAAFFGGVNAMALPSVKRHQSVFDVERTGNKSANVTRVNGTATSIGHKHKQSQQSVNMTVVDVPSKRWGHSVTYLKEANVALFVGGQVSAENDSMVLTNDVFAMDLNVNSNQTWVRLSSENLAPHAFASRAVTHDEEGSDERVFIVGGATNDCSSNASQISMWKAGKSWQDGQWSTPSFSEGAAVPERRRGARAIQVPVEMSMRDEEAQRAIVEGGVSFMVIGGSSDESTCSNMSSLSSNVDVWTMGAGEGRRASTAASTFDTRALVLSAELANISVADYSAIYLPANGTQGDRVLLMGGVDKDGNLTSFENPWVLDLSSGLWSKMPTTNSTSNGHDIPHGRIGHTSTRTKNGTIIVYGGFTSLANDGVPTSDVHVLNYTVNPAVWSRVNSSRAPKRAFHTAFMAGQIMVVGFGQGNYDLNSTSASNSNTTTEMHSRSVSSSQAVEFLDTSSAKWTWAGSMADVLAARQPSTSSIASTTPTASVTVSATASVTPVSKPTTTVAHVKATSSIDTVASTEAYTPVETASSSSDDEPTSTDDSSSSYPVASSNSPIAEPTSTNNGSSSITPQQRNTAVIASVLGAAAIAASLAGLYTAHKRREARLNGDHYSMSGDKYEHFSSSAPGPPVSSLWLHQLKRKATLASDAMMNRGRSFKKGSSSPNSGAASAGNSPRSFWAGYSNPAANETDFRVIRNMPPTSRLSMRRSEMMQQEATREQLYMQESMQSDLPDSFLHSILNDDNDMRRTMDSGLSVPLPAAYNTRALSSESLESDGALSHFSYPYLSAMNRLTGSPSTNGSPSGSSPRYSPQSDKNFTTGGYSNFAMTPTWSSPSLDAVEIMTEEMQSSMESLQSQSNPFEDMTKSPSAMMESANYVSSPFFPRDDAPMVPQQVYLEENDQGQRKFQQSTLRVMNDADY